MCSRWKWSDALPFFFAAMLEHRAEEYENFNVPKKEKWDRIVQQLLQQGPPEKRRKLDEGEALDPLTRKRYVHQGEVFGVLMAFLREEPKLPSSLAFHVGQSYKKIQSKVKAKYCNITDEVIKDFFRALDLWYHLCDIPLPAGRIKHTDLKPLKKLDLKEVLNDLTLSKGAQRLKELLKGVARSGGAGSVLTTTQLALSRPLAQETGMHASDTRTT
jgi:hypothetical protein